MSTKPPVKKKPAQAQTSKRAANKKPASHKVSGKKRAPRSKLNKAQIEAMFFRMQEARPEPKSELNYHNSYTLVVAVALSAQATDIGVNKATKALFEKVSTPEQMVKLGEQELIEHIRTIGLFRTKAKNVIALSKMIIDDFAGEVPQTREELEKTAWCRT